VSIVGAGLAQRGVTWTGNENRVPKGFGLARTDAVENKANEEDFIKKVPKRCGGEKTLEIPQRERIVGGPKKERKTKGKKATGG